MDVVEAKEGFVLLTVRVQPKSSRLNVTVEPDGRVRVAVTAPPVGGAANRAVADYMAKVFKIPRRNVTVIKGEKSRDKTLKIEGLTAEAVRSHLAERRKGS